MIFAILEYFSRFWIFLETSWRRMNCRQATHVVAAQFSGFPYEPPGG